MTETCESQARAPRFLTGNSRQIAAVRRITLDDGAERGNRALAFSTGGGLDFWVLSDRSLDIGPLWFEGRQCAWEHPAGYIAPAQFRRDEDGQTGIERALSGFLVTCGAEHARQPVKGQALHGNLPLTPARVTSYGEDWDSKDPLLFCEGEITVAHLAKASYRLKRRIEAPVGSTRLSIIDTFENIGLAPFDLSLLYHLNFGFPAIGSDTNVDINENNWLITSGPENPDLAADPVFMCRRVEDSSKTKIDVMRPSTDNRRGFHAHICTHAQQLPFVQIWSDPRPQRNILAIEPSNCERLPNGTSGPGATLQIGESWTNRIEIKFSGSGD
jgi:hypothetical protein